MNIQKTQTVEGTIVLVTVLIRYYVGLQPFLFEQEKYPKKYLIGVFPKCFHLIEKYLSLKEFKPATSYVRDQDATTAHARYM